MKIGVMFGNPETTTGGNALKFYASVRMDIRKIATLKQGDQVIGSRTRVKVVKNKVAPPFKEVEFDILYGEGISRTGDVLDLAVDKNIVEKSGAWYSYGKERIGQGRENSRTWLTEHPEVLAEIEGKLMDLLKPAPAPDKAAKLTRLRSSGGNYGSERNTHHCRLRPKAPIFISRPVCRRSYESMAGCIRFPTRRVCRPTLLPRQPSR